MTLFLRHFQSFTIRWNDKLVLAFSWILGLGAGGLVFRYAGDSLIPLMPLAVKSQLSIVGLFLNACLPFLLSAFAVFISRPRVLLLIGFGESFLYAYLLCGVFACYDSSGWLIRWLLLFTDSVSAALLYGYASRHISGLRGVSAAGIAACLCGLAVLVGVDYAYFSPLLRALLS